MQDQIPPTFAIVVVAVVLLLSHWRRADLVPRRLRQLGFTRFAGFLRNLFKCLR